MTTPQTTPTATQTQAAIPIPPTRDELLLADARAALASAQEAAERARLDTDEAQRQLDAARMAQAARAAALAEAREQAQAAATTSITSGTALASEDENRASYEQWRGEQELARAAAAVATLEAAHSTAHRRYAEASAAVASAAHTCEQAEQRLAATALAAEASDLVARLVEVAARIRAHNETVTGTARAGMQAAQPGMPYAQYHHRRAAENAGTLVLPGAATDSARRPVDLRASRALGFALVWAPDLSQPDGDMSTNWTAL